MKLRILVIVLVMTLAFAIVEFTIEPKNEVLALKVYFALYFTYLMFELGSHIKKVEQYVDNPLKGVGTFSCVKHLNEQEFYATFLHLVSNEARTRVCISYMHDTPPSTQPGSSQDKYYSDVKKVIRKKKTVTFERVILGSKANASWIIEMLEEFKGCKNFTLSYIDPSDLGGNLPPVSVQCIDEKYTFLVAVAHQKQLVEKRDMLITEKDTTSKFLQYYQKILGRSNNLFQNGQVNGANLQKLKRILGE